jgi:ribosome-binding protein aMBF1 (putative translation factor)
MSHMVIYCTPQDLHTAIRDARKARGLRPVDLAERVGILRSNVNRIESGRHKPHLDTISRVGEALNVRFVLKLGS